MIDPLDDPYIAHRRQRTKQAIMDTAHDIITAIRHLYRYAVPVFIIVIIFASYLCLTFVITDVWHNFKLTGIPYWMTFVFQAVVQIGFSYCLPKAIGRYFRHRR